MGVLVLVDILEERVEWYGVGCCVVHLELCGHVIDARDVILVALVIVIVAVVVAVGELKLLAMSG